jgi:Protein of unknown function (DUF2855)
LALMNQTSFLVARDDLRRCRFDTAALDALQAGDVLLQVDRFSFTANNITYAETGDVLRYWQFYPAPVGWGIIPVWGHADVIDSRHDAIAPGERLYGFWPMATHVRLRPERVDPQRLVDGTAHRRELPAGYNTYQRCAGDPLYDPRYEDLQSLLYGLFSTGFLIDDFLAEHAFFGARMVVISSASSKTACSLAHQLHRRGQAVEAVGLTSAGNHAFVAGLGLYDRVLTYDQLAQLDQQAPAVFVDFAGNGNVRTAVHAHFVDNLTYSMAVGMSHRDLHPPGKGLPGARPEFFFAPTQRQKRAQDWGRDGFAARFGEAWRTFLASAEGWLKVTRSSGQEAVERTYLDTLEGKVAPDAGNILSL